MLRKIYLILLFITGVTAAQINQTPSITNVTFSQRTDGSHIVDVYFDLEDADGNLMTVEMEVSSDGGENWDFPCNRISGDIGEEITSGERKHIVWDFGKEHNETFGDQFIIKITADDGQGEGVYYPCPDVKKVYYEGGPYKDDNGRYYLTVLIEGRCWLRENLNVGTMLHSNSSESNQTNNGILEKYCYDNDESNCDLYGGLYQWNEAMQYATGDERQGICPEGWHVATLVEYESLEALANDEAEKLVAVGQYATAYIATNVTGFTGVFSGYRLNSNGNFYSLRHHTNFWTSTPLNSANAYEMGLSSNTKTVYFNTYDKKDGYSIRCVMD